MNALGKNWKGTFPGNYSGNLWQTFNIDLERQPGRLALSDKMRRLSTGLGVVTKFIKTNATATTQWFALCPGDILRNNEPVLTDGTWASDNTTGSFDTPLDGVIHEVANGEQRLFVTTPTNIAVLNTSGAANVWDVDWGSTIPSVPIPVTSLVHRPIAKLQRLLAIANKVTGVPKIDTIDQADSVTLGAITFPTEYTIRVIYASSNRFWIGLQHDMSGNARIIEWDGFSESYNNAYDLIGSTPLSGFIVNDIPYFITETGKIFRYTGGGFSEVQSFHLEEDRILLPTAPNTGIGPYSCWVDGDIVYINFGAPVLQGFSATNFPLASRRTRAGIWIFNTRNLNLYHHMGLGEHVTANTDVNYGTSVYGETASVGAVVKQTELRTLHASASIYVGGATWQASQANGIYYSIPNTVQASSGGRNRGYFITPYIPVNDIEVAWEALWVKFKKFVNSNNRIIVKWRVADPLNNPAAADQGGNLLTVIDAPATWVTTTTFTCKVPTGVAVGDEIEVLTGDNSGCSFKISALSGTPDNSTTLTVTIAEAAPTSSTDTFLARFDNWKTEAAIDSTTIGHKKVPFTAPAHGQFIQLKIELRGFDVQIDELSPEFQSLTTPKQT